MVSVPQRKRTGLTPKQRHNTLLAMAFISPWIVGFLWFLLYPVVYSLYLSFTRYTGFGSPTWIGLENYGRMFSDDLFWTSLYNTIYYTVLSVPIGAAVAMTMAIAMNQRLREVGLYRAALYLPSVLPLFAVSFIFIALLNPQYGLINAILRAVGLDGINWLGDPNWAKIAIVGMAQLGAGNAALVFLAGLRAVPITLYESAELDGAGTWRKFWSITLPLITPILLYNVILGLGQGLQVFTQAYILTGGGPNNATLFYVYFLYNNAFSYSQMGYASALSWVLFVISFGIALLVFRWSNRWVNYELVT